MSQKRGNDEEGRIEISENYVDEGTDKVRSLRKCSRYRRPCSEHKGPIGTRCKLEPRDEEQVEEHYKEWNARRRKDKQSHVLLFSVVVLSVSSALLISSFVMTPTFIFFFIFFISFRIYLT